jgi:hypothetical protein
MQQLWPRGGRPRRLAAVVAAAAAVLLAAARPIESAPAPSGAAATPSCSEATARQLVQQHRLNSFDLPNPVRQVLCGPFTGDGSEAMAVTIGAPTCWPVQRWAVFRFAGGAWQLVFDRSEFVSPPLVAVGGDIRVTTPVYRHGDARCLPSGGTEARTWHWDGARFVAGAPRQVRPAALTPISFLSPSGNIACSIGDVAQFRGVRCQSGRRPQSVRLNLNGRLTICRALRCGFCGCSEGLQVLGYGKGVSVGRFSCRSLRTGMRCVVTASGRGFLINRSAITPVRP